MFYGKRNWVYPIATREEIKKAVEEYMQENDISGRDSCDREKIRDIIGR